MLSDRKRIGLHIFRQLVFLMSHKSGNFDASF
jgi:hypothetical protein